MGRVLIVDTNEADRAKVTGLLASLGHTWDTAPDGSEAFETMLADASFDLLVTEVDLPKLDGAALVAKLRAHGVKTPVLALTAVTKAATVAALMRLPNLEYLHKSCSPAELTEKLSAALAHTAPAAPVAAAPVAVAAGEHVETLLLIDHLQVVRDRLLELLPPSVRVEWCQTPAEGLERAQRGAFRVVLFDLAASVLHLGGVVTKLNLLQPEAVTVATGVLGEDNDERALAASARSFGFDDFLLKPFEAGKVTLLVEEYCASYEQLVSVQKDVLQVSRLRCRSKQHTHYLEQLTRRVTAALQPLCDDCFDQALVDLTCAMPCSGPEFAGVFKALHQAAEPLGITVGFVVNRATAAALAEQQGLEKLKWFTSLEAARQALS
jgi:DNA-binding response OmpR family regulator